MRVVGKCLTRLIPGSIERHATTLNRFHLRFGRLDCKETVHLGCCEIAMFYRAVLGIGSEVRKDSLPTAVEIFDVTFDSGNVSHRYGNTVCQEPFHTVRDKSKRENSFQENHIRKKDSECDCIECCLPDSNRRGEAWKVCAAECLKEAQTMA